MTSRLFRYRFRRDLTASGWSVSNPILLSGEPGVESDTGKFKIGDGVTAWNSLQYAGGGSTPAAHATTHEDGGTDELDITLLAGYPTPASPPEPILFLREDRTFALPSSAGGGSLLSLPPDLGTWTQVNYGTSTSDNNNGFIYLETQDPGASGSPKIRALAQSLPGGTFDLKSTFVHLFAQASSIGSNSNAVGIGLRDSSGGGIIAFSFLVNNSTWYIQINRFTSPTVFSANSLSLTEQNWRFTAGAIGFRIRQASGTRYFDWSNDQGGHWKNIFSEGDTAFITPDQAILFADCETNTLTVGVTLTGWDLA